ncbi:hypothetical protein AB0O91_05545 [Kitasatospora sp. NPDC089797]|uniref:hypothetical protein n=1 Tax=Kitasatospora sp. NPDC089797 TaxID=3155298 RepID=UPI003420B57E
MYITVGRLVRGMVGPEQVTPDKLVELLRNAAEPADGLEHVYVEIDPLGADLVFFLGPPKSGNLDSAAQRITSRCLRDAPELRGWRLAAEFSDDRLPLLEE